MEQQAGGGARAQDTGFAPRDAAGGVSWNMVGVAFGSNANGETN